MTIEDKFKDKEFMDSYHKYLKNRYGENYEEKLEKMRNQ